MLWAYNRGKWPVYNYFLAVNIKKRAVYNYFLTENINKWAGIGMKPMSAQYDYAVMCLFLNGSLSSSEACDWHTER